MPREYVVDIGDEAIEAGETFAEAVHWAQLAVDAPPGEEIILQGGRHGVTARAAVVLEYEAPDFTGQESGVEADRKMAAGLESKKHVYATWKRLGPRGWIVCGSSEPHIIEQVYRYVMGRSRDLPACAGRS
jgi:hypothetical protein